MLRSYRLFFRLAARSLLGRETRLSPRRIAVMLVFLPVFFMLLTVHWLALLLDEVLFPSFRRIEVREPVFIVGLPRSGTSFLHRVLALDEERFTTTALWELVLAPAISERLFWRFVGRVDARIGRPLARLLALLERRALGSLDDIHATTLQTPEEDYMALAPVFACFILVLPFPCAEEIWQLARFDSDMPRDEQDRVMAFYRKSLQRHLYVHGPHLQVLSKNPAFSPTVEALQRTFPGARFICNVRCPLEAVPSLLSSMDEGARLFGLDTSDGTFHRRLVDMLAHFQHHLLAVLPEMPRDRHAFVTMESLSRDVRETVEQVYRRFGFDLTPTFRDRLRAVYERSRGYRSSHQYVLDDYGLTAADIRRRFGPLVEEFGYDHRFTGTLKALPPVDSQPANDDAAAA